MYLEDFKVEKWLNPLDPLCKYNLGASCVKAMRVDELFEVTGEDLDAFMEEVRGMRLHYGYFPGSPRLKAAISGLYRKATPEMVLTVHGGTGANNMIITGLVERGDNVVAVKPNYQQHYEIPASIGAEVRTVQLKEEDDYRLNLDEVRNLVDKKTKLITLSNPNNPTGVYLGEKELTELAEIARSAGAYILCDEIYRGIDEEYMPSIVDVYEKGISSSSMSKVFSMAGTRVGWIVTPDREAWEILENRRSYDTICGGVFDELISAIALEHHDKILARARNIIRKNRPILDEWLKTQPHLSCKGDSRGSTCLIRYDFDIPSEQFCQDLLDQTGLLLCHGDCFDEPKSFRLGYCFDDGETLRIGLGLLGDYLAGLEK